MRKVIILIIFLIASGSVYGKSGWIEQNSGILQDIYSLDFINENTGFASSPKILLKTTNGGATWDTINTSGNFSEIKMFNENTGFLSKGVQLYKTTNGGINITPMSTIFNGGIRDFQFIDQNIGLLITNSKFYKTFNSGQSWINYPFSYWPIYPSSISFVNENTGWLVYTWDAPGPTFTLEKTTNSGINWGDKRWMYSQNPFKYSPRVYFCNNDTGFVFIPHKLGTIYRSYHGGYNLTASTEVGQEVISGFHFISSSTGWAYGPEGLCYTSNAGINWSMQLNNSRGIYGVCFVNDSVGWAVGGWGKIYKTTTGGVVGINPIGGNIPQSFSLHQNYPNPFNPSTKIKFDIPKGSLVKLKIYDMLGREVATLVNEKLNPGTYEYEWNGINLPSGVYFYKIEAENFIETKRMVLIK
jgi:photosystem II stability/assembly factor-like uncharacterized protein